MKDGFLVFRGLVVDEGPKKTMEKLLDIGRGDGLAKILAIVGTSRQGKKCTPIFNGFDETHGVIEGDGQRWSYDLEKSRKTYRGIDADLRRAIQATFPSLPAMFSKLGSPVLLIRLPKCRVQPMHCDFA